MSLFWNLYAVVYDVIAALYPYQQMIQRIVELVRLGNGEEVLDAGCGTGNITMLLGDYDVTGVDSSTSMLGRAARKAPKANLRMCDLNKGLPFADRVFDAVVCCNVIYALSDPAAALVELKRVLKRGGILVVSTPKCEPSIKTIVGEHIRARGWMSMVPIAVPLILVGVFNLIILKRGGDKQYHFFTENEIRGLVGEGAAVESTYAGQNWLVTLWKE